MRLILLLACMTGGACGGDEAAPGGMGSGLPVVSVECEEPEVALPDGSCIRPGIPPDGCSKGFEHDGEYGCNAIMPDDDCLPGMMAVPGDEACRPVMPCGEGKWGNLPVDASTQYVDADYQAGNSDGTSAKPWTTIGDAYGAASAGDLIAVAAGHYPTALLFRDKPVRLWGICPEKVSLESLGSNATITMLGDGDGFEIGGLAISSRAIGVRLAGTLKVTLDQVWIHDTTESGIVLQHEAGRPSLRFVNSLVEAAHGAGVYTVGGVIHLDSSVVRNTMVRLPQQDFGVGVFANSLCSGQACDPLSRPRVTIEGSRIEGSRTLGIGIWGGDLDMTASVIRGTLPRPADQRLGQGVEIGQACYNATGCESDQPSHAKIVGSLIENNHAAGLFVSASQLELATTVVRGGKPQALDQTRGDGIILTSACDSANCDASAASRATIQSSLVENNHASAIAMKGSTATIERTVARRTKPQESNLHFGMGIAVQHACILGRNCDAKQASEVTLNESLIANNHVAGVWTIGSVARLTATVVRHTMSRQADELFGDGLLFVSQRRLASGFIDGLSVADSARAGLSNFGAEIILKDTSIACAALALSAERYEAQPALFEDSGGNGCGCPAPDGTCKAVSVGLEPPRPPE